MCTVHSRSELEDSTSVTLTSIDLEKEDLVDEKWFHRMFQLPLH